MGGTIEETVYCTACGGQRTCTIPAGCIVLDGVIIDCDDRDRGRIRCETCDSDNTCCSNDP